ncbi:hypothetical protein C8J57DRAFT_1519006 [Mycena rebaudengoi]|nr:hypothetical protein C8J57DRAFT_1519006 [Mycena rebaudengoi]
MARFSADRGTSQTFKLRGQLDTCQRVVPTGNESTITCCWSPFRRLLLSPSDLHHVDDLTLVAAFFFFSIGCLNMLFGLIFCEGAKTKRSHVRQTCSNQGKHRPHQRHGLVVHVCLAVSNAFTHTSSFASSRRFASPIDD